MIRRRAAIPALLVALLLTGVAQAGPSLRESLTGAAKTEYEAARLLFSDRDFAGALVKFSSAYDHSHDPRLIFNMAACEKNLRHYAKAASLLRRYESEGRAVLSPGDVHEADQLIDTFRPFIGTVQLGVSEGGATVSVDDEPVGTTPLGAPLVLDIGEHQLVVSKPGWKPFEKSLHIAGPDGGELDVDLQRDVHEGIVTIRAGADDAITVDGKLVATGAWTAHLPSGAHTLTVTAEGMRTYQTELFVEDDKARTINVTLEQEAKRAVPGWVWVSGGVILATGAAVAAAAVFRSYPTLALPATKGTISPGVAMTSWRFP